MIKVCHMTSVHAPEDGRIFRKECTSLSKAGYDTYLVEQGETYEKNGVHIIGVGKPENNRIKRMLSMTRKVYKKAKEIDADIYHFHDPELLFYGLKLKRKGKVVIFDSHENTAMSIKEKTYIPLLFRNIIFHLYSSIEKYVCHRLDAVIYVSPNFHDTFSLLNGNIVLITNYPILEEKVDRIATKDNQIVFAGVINDQWNHHVILEAMKSVENVSYTMCGPIIDEYLEALKTYETWKRTRYLGKVSYDEVKKLLSMGSVGVALLQPGLNTSGWQGTLGNTKLFEEMMAGLPVICTKFDLWKDIVESNECGICVDPNNSDEIAKAINTFIQNPKLAKRMGDRGRQLVEEKYNWSVEEKKLLNLYSELCETISN